MAHRTLFLIRHAHAASGGDDDHARPLSLRGQQQAEHLGQWLAAHEPRPTRVWHSDALRTTMTSEGLAEAFAKLDLPLAIEARGDLYQASASHLLRVASTFDDSASSVALVAHNPGMAEATARLARHAGVAAAQLPPFVPASASVFRFDGPWAALATSPCERLAAYHPR